MDGIEFCVGIIGKHITGSFKVYDGIKINARIIGQDVFVVV